MKTQLGEIIEVEHKDGLSQKEKKAGRKKNYMWSAENERILVKESRIFEVWQIQKEFFPLLDKTQLSSKLQTLKKTGKYSLIMKELDEQTRLGTHGTIKETYLCKRCMHFPVCSFKNKIKEFMLTLPKTIAIGVYKCDYYLLGNEQTEEDNLKTSK